MPSLTMGADGTPRLAFSSQDDLLTWLNAAIYPVANLYGYRIVVEPLPKADVLVDRV